MAKTSVKSKRKSSRRMKPVTGATMKARKCTTQWFVSPMIPKSIKLNFPPVISAPEIPLCTASCSWQPVENETTPDFDTAGLLDVIVEAGPSAENTPLSSLATDRISRKKLFRSSIEFPAPFDRLSLCSDFSFEERQPGILPREYGEPAEEDDSKDSDYRISMGTFSSVDLGRSEELCSDSETTPLHRPHRGNVSSTVGAIVFVPETPEREPGPAGRNSCAF